MHIYIIINTHIINAYIHHYKYTYDYSLVHTLFISYVTHLRNMYSFCTYLGSVSK